LGFTLLAPRTTTLDTIRFLMMTMTTTGRSGPPRRRRRPLRLRGRASPGASTWVIVAGLALLIDVAVVEWSRSRCRGAGASRRPQQHQCRRLGGGGSSWLPPLGWGVLAEEEEEVIEEGSNGGADDRGGRPVNSAEDGEEDISGSSSRSSSRRSDRDEEEEEERCQWSGEDDDGEFDESCENVEEEEDAEEGSRDDDEEEEDEFDYVLDESSNPSASSSPPNSWLLQLTIEALSDADKYRKLFIVRSAGSSDGTAETTSDEPRSLVLALVHDDSCPHSLEMLDKFEAAAYQLKDVPNLKLGLLSLESTESLQAFAVDRIPTLLFLSWLSETNSVVLIEYNGLSDTSENIADTARHYHHRLVRATSGWELSKDMVHVKPPQYASWTELHDHLRTSRALDPTVNPRVPVPLPPTLAPGDVRFARWLMEEEEEVQAENEGSLSPYSLPDESKVFVQCRLSSAASSPTASEAYRLFDQASRALSNRRDCFFATVEECGRPHFHHGNSISDEEGDDDSNSSSDGTVAAFAIPYDWDYRYMDFVTNLDPILLRHETSTNGGPGRQAYAASALIHDMAQFARPSVLWFDRQSTAPIVFGFQQQRHAVMVVDMHPVITAPNSTRLEDMKAVRTTFVHFRRACRKHRHQIACMVVPSTETRVLITLGVDIWTPMDEQATKHRSTSHPPADSTSADQEGLRPRPLPVVILTDRDRVPGKTLTHVLDRDRLLLSLSADPPSPVVEQFFDDFVSHRLEPKIKTDPRGPRTNAAGVRILTGASVHELYHSDRHALVLFVTSTCGHCKRATVIWDRLARFVARVGWSSSFVRLYRMDVSENDVPDGVTPRWLPDAYYYHPHRGTSDGSSSSNFTRFDWIQDDGDEDNKNGASDDFLKKYDPSSSDAIDWDVTTLLEWFVSVAHLSDDEISGLLHDLEG
jgi:hypothetical protein